MILLAVTYTFCWLQALQRFLVCTGLGLFRLRIVRFEDVGCLQVHTKIVRPLSLQRRPIHWQTSKPTPAPLLMAPASRMVASLPTFCDSSHLEIVGPRIMTWFVSKKQTLHEGTPTTARARPGQRPAKPGKAVRSSTNSLIVIRNHGFGSSAQTEILGCPGQLPARESL